MESCLRMKTTKESEWTVVLNHEDIHKLLKIKGAIKDITYEAGNLSIVSHQTQFGKDPKE